MEDNEDNHSESATELCHSESATELCQETRQVVFMCGEKTRTMSESDCFNVCVLRQYVALEVVEMVLVEESSESEELYLGESDEEFIPGDEDEMDSSDSAVSSSCKDSESSTLYPLLSSSHSQNTSAVSSSPSSSNDVTSSCNILESPPISALTAAGLMISVPSFISHTRHTDTSPNASDRPSTSFLKTTGSVSTVGSCSSSTSRLSSSFSGSAEHVSSSGTSTLKRPSASVFFLHHPVKLRYILQPTRKVKGCGTKGIGVTFVKNLVLI